MYLSFSLCVNKPLRLVLLEKCLQFLFSPQMTMHLNFLFKKLNSAILFIAESNDFDREHWPFVVVLTCFLNGLLRVSMIVKWDLVNFEKS